MKTEAQYSTTYFYWPVRMLKWSGISLYNINQRTPSVLYKIYSLSISIFLITYMACASMHVYSQRDNLDELTLTFGYVFAQFNGMAKIAVFVWKREKIVNILARIEKGMFLPNSRRGGEVENKIINYAVWRTNMQAKIFTSMLVIDMSSGTLKYILNQTSEIFDPTTNATITFLKLPYPFSIPGIEFISSKFDVFIVFGQISAFMLYAWYFTLADVIITGLMIHAKAQFQVLINALKKCPNFDSMEHAVETKHTQNFINYQGYDIEITPSYDAIFLKRYKKCVNDCLRLHNEILDFVDDLESTFSICIFIQFTVNIITTCVGLFQISEMGFSDPSILSRLMFVNAMVLQIFLYCWNGNEVSVYSEKVGEAAYFSGWLESDKDIKMSISLIILRSQRMCYFTSGKLFKISLATSVSVLKGAFSYFMLLREIKEGKNTSNEQF